MRNHNSPPMDATVTSGPTAPVPKDPKPSVDRIEELARRVLSGDILLPKFQRDFVWDRSQVLDLLDSVARNYPIGSILLWQSRRELRSENRIADLEITLPKPDYPVNYLLDGQQRLSSICGALFWRGQNPHSIWNLAYNLRTGRFLHLDTSDDPPQHQMRTNTLADAAEFYRHVAALDTLTASDKDDLKAAADELFRRFKDYKLAAVTLADMSIQDVAPIFERINSTGTQLTIVDLMRAATWSQDFDLIDSIDAIRNALAEKNFAGIDRKVILRNMSAAAGGDFSVSSIDALRRHDADTLKKAASDAEQAYRRTVDFLTTELRIPGDGVIPYANQMVVLAELFRLLPSPNAAQHDAIRTWFWRTASSGYFSGWNTGMMATDKDAVAAFAAGTTDEIVVATTPPRPEIWIDRTFRANGAHAKTLAIVLAYQEPVDLLVGRRIDVAKSLAWTNAKEFHHFFPRDYLKNEGVSSGRANCLANIVMLTLSSNKQIANRPPSEYLCDIQVAAGANLNAWLKSNLIPSEAYEAALRDDYEQFLRLRSQSINELVSTLAGW